MTRGQSQRASGDGRSPTSGAPGSDAAPDAVDPRDRVEHERHREVRPVLLVGELEEVELLGDPAILVGEEGEVRANAGPEGAVRVRAVDSHGGDLPVLALDFVLHPHEVADADLLLRAPPAADKAHDERLALRDLAERELLAGVLGETDVRKSVARNEVL